MGPFAAWLLVLMVVGVLTVVGDKKGSDPPVTAPVETVAERVEAIRGLEFERIPETQRISAEAARRAGLADFDTDYPPERRRQDETLYVSLGLLPLGTDLKEEIESIFTTQVAGFYDPRRDRLRLVDGPGSSGRVLAEMVMAHELNHALEDQRFDLDLERMAEGGDVALAYLALVEGTATSLMGTYLARHFSAEEALGGLLSSAFAPTGGLPNFLMAQLLFPYVRGEQFVAELRRGGSWRLVDLAYRFRPPASTEQILHPRKYLEVEEPHEVHLPGAQGVFGEWQTAELLALAGGTDAERAAAGWGGDAYAVREDAVVIRWLWDTPRDRAHFLRKLRDYTEEMDRGTVTTDGDAVTLTVPALGPAR